MEYCRIFLSAGTQSPFRYGNIFQSCGPALFVPGQIKEFKMPLSPYKFKIKE